MDVSVVVPLSIEKCEYRKRIWEFIRKKWETTYPNWKIVIGECNNCEDGWRKGVAVFDGVSKTDSEFIIVADADVWVSNLHKYINKNSKVVKPNRAVYRLTEYASELVLSGKHDINKLWKEKSMLLEKPYRQVFGGGLLFLRRDIYIDIPIDPRFCGWGKEDSSWGLALKTLVEKGNIGRGQSPLIHLYHPPEPRVKRNKAFEHNEEIYSEYKQAYKDIKKMSDIMKNVGGINNAI